MKAEMVDDICKAVETVSVPIVVKMMIKEFFFQYEMPKVGLSFLTYWPKLSFEPEYLIAKLFSRTYLTIPNGKSIKHWSAFLP